MITISSQKFWNRGYICYPLCPVWVADPHGEARTKPRGYGHLTWPFVRLWCLYALKEFPITLCVGECE